MERFSNNLPESDYVLLSLGENIFVLRVPEGEGPLSLLVAHHERQADETGHERHERRGPIIILARGHGRLPLAKIKAGLGASTHDRDSAERGIRVMSRELVGGRAVSRNREPAALLENRR